MEIETYGLNKHNIYIDKMFDRNRGGLKKRQRKPHPKMRVCFHLIDFNPKIKQWACSSPLNTCSTMAL